MSNPNPYRCGNMCAKNDILIHEGAPRNGKQKAQQVANAKRMKAREPFNPAKHKMIKHPTIKGAYLQVDKNDPRT